MLVVPQKQGSMKNRRSDLTFGTKQKQKHGIETMFGIQQKTPRIQNSKPEMRPMFESKLKKESEIRPTRQQRASSGEFDHIAVV